VGGPYFDVIIKNRIKENASVYRVQRSIFIKSFDFNNNSDSLMHFYISINSCYNIINKEKINVFY